MPRRVSGAAAAEPEHEPARDGDERSDRDQHEPRAGGVEAAGVRVDEEVEHGAHDDQEYSDAEGHAPSVAPPSPPEWGRIGVQTGRVSPRGLPATLGRLTGVTRAIDLALIPGDGIGPEVVEQAVDVLRAAVGGEAELRTTEYPFSARHYLESGVILGDDDLAALAQHEAILLGAVGGDPRDARLAGGIIERGLLLKLRFAFDHYVNLRPTRLFPSVTSPLADPGEVDFVVVREGTEGPYVGTGGSIRVGTPHEIANEVSVNTAHGVQRLVRYAFAAAEKRRKKLTLVHKTNVLTYSGSLWTRAVQAEAANHPDVDWDYLHVDAATIFLVTDPARFDVIVTDNLFGDILTDLAGAISGGIGLAASGNINPDGTFPSMFEPVHGSAPDIAGQQKADPTAAILSTVLLLDHLGLPEAARRIEAAVAGDLADRGSASRTTAEVGAAITARL